VREGTGEPGAGAAGPLNAVNISLLRKALGEDAENYIETVPRRGYRFTAGEDEVAGHLPAAKRRPILPLVAGVGALLLRVILRHFRRRDRKDAVDHSIDKLLLRIGDSTELFIYDAPPRLAHVRSCRAGLACPTKADVNLLEDGPTSGELIARHGRGALAERGPAACSASFDYSFCA
jgi:hypothetical protein